MTKQDYDRRRDRAIKDGAWVPAKPNRVQEPTIVPTEADVAWAAGFLEGEGWFGMKRTTTCVKAAQVNSEPLERLRALFGGSIRKFKPKSGRDCYEWYAGGRRALHLLFRLYRYMSPHRQNQIDKSLGATA